MVPFPENVLLWRLERRLTQDGLARRAGIPRPSVSGIERGRRDPALSTLLRIADALGVSPGTLVDGIPPGAGESPAASRAALERIARGARGGPLPRRPGEARVAGLLRTVTASRRAVEAPRGRSPRLRPRAAERAWLALRAALPAAMLRTLLDRATQAPGRGTP